MSDTFNSDEFHGACRNCGGDSFSRRRTLTERESLELDDDRFSVADSDVDVTGEWEFSCDDCGLAGGDLEDILAVKDADENDDEFERGIA